jgi:hypothetical protein
MEISTLSDTLMDISTQAETLMEIPTLAETLMEITTLGGKSYALRNRSQTWRHQYTPQSHTRNINADRNTTHEDTEITRRSGNADKF